MAVDDRASRSKGVGGILSQGASNISKPQLFAIVALACLLSAFIVFGIELAGDRHLSDLGAPFFARWLLVFAGVAAVLAASVLFRNARKPKRFTWDSGEKRMWLALIAAVLCVTWGISLLGAWPGFYIDDQGGYGAYLASGYLSEQQSVFHTLFQGTLLRVGSTLFASFNWAVACSVIVQLGICLGIVVWSLAVLMEEGMGRRGIALAAAYFAVNPYILMLNVSTVKDVLFSYYTLAFCVLLCHMLRAAKPKPTQMVGLVALTFLVLVYRNNAFPAFLVFVPLSLLLLFKVRDRTALIRMLAPLAIGAVLFLGFKGPVCSMLQADSPNSVREMISVPAMEIARVCTESEEMRDAVDDAGVDSAEVVDSYRSLASNSDRVRVLFWDMLDAEGQGLGAFLKLWLQARQIDPLACIEADMVLAEASWSPVGVMDGYEGMYLTSTPTYGFSPTAEEPAALSSKIPALFDWFYRLARYNTPTETGLLFPVVSVFPYVWIAIVATVFATVERNRPGIAVTLFPMLIVLTNWLGPLVVMRYYFHLVLLLPPMLWYCWPAGGPDGEISSTGCRPDDAV